MEAGEVGPAASNVAREEGGRRSVALGAAWVCRSSVEEVAAEGTVSVAVAVVCLC